jgi:GNAT superfamily N-acetyltransferase
VSSAETRVSVRPVRPGDGPALARLHRANTAYNATLSPDLFRVADEEGLVEFSEPGPDANTETSLALVAELHGEVAGYLEATLQPPMETSRYQGQTDLGQTRLFINYVGTSKEHWRRGVATSLVEAAEAWGRERGATVALCDTYVGSPVSMPFWEKRMGYRRRAVIFRKRL